MNLEAELVVEEGQRSLLRQADHKEAGKNQFKIGGPALEVRCSSPQRTVLSLSLSASFHPKRRSESKMMEKRLLAP